MSTADPFGHLLEVFDRRAQAFGPDHTATLGYYADSETLGVPSVLLDDGREIPNPVTTKGVQLGQRVLVLWMQGGHDVCLVSFQVCPTFIGSVFPELHNGTRHRGNFGVDRRGESFWLAGSAATPGTVDFVEEWSFPGLELLQRFDLPTVTINGFTHSGWGDFWGGDGEGGIIYLHGNAVVRRTAGGVYSTVYSPVTFGGIDVGQDTLRDRYIIVERNTFDTPTNINIRAFDNLGVVTTLVAGLPMPPGLMPNVASPVMTPDGAVWFRAATRFGTSPHVARWSAADGLRVRPIASGSGAMVPRPDNTIWIALGSSTLGSAVVEIDAYMEKSSINCDDLVGIAKARTTLGIVGGSIIVPNMIPALSNSVQWDIWGL